MRADWLRRRQNLRSKAHVLQLGLDGSERTKPVVQPADDPLRLEDEALAPTVPAPDGLLHVSALASGIHQHVLESATALAVPEGATLYAWVLIDREHAPQQLMLQFHAGSWEHRIYWGASLIGWGNEGSTSRLKASDELPPPGVWTRLALPAHELGLEGRRIDGIAFTLHGGRACFGPAGLLSGNTESVWLTQELLDAGRLRGDGEGWQIVAAADRDAPFEAAFGARDDDGAHESVDLAALLDDADVKVLKIIPTGGKREDAPTLAALIGTQGLRATVADLGARIDEADDALNLGFLRVQTDLYRLRQAVLKQTQATRFAVSPALTQIADLDNASATREQLADFYADVRADATLLKRESGSGTQLEPRFVRSSVPVAPAPAPRSGVGMASLRPDVFSNTAPATRFERPVEAMAPAPMTVEMVRLPGGITAEPAVGIDFLRPGAGTQFVDLGTAGVAGVRPGWPRHRRRRPRSPAPMR